MNIAVLMTCHNRRALTLDCLDSFYKATSGQNGSFDLFMVDDGSTDQTSEAVNDKYPDVNIIKGNGNLFWNQGMRLAWDTATKRKDYDYYIWLNNDVILFKNAITELINCYLETKKINKSEAIITGACQKSIDLAEFSYGGRNDDGPVLPNGQSQSCRYINGNIVLVSKNIYKKIGILSPDYTHAMGDIDYGLNALQAGFHCYTTPTYVAICPPNTKIQEWCSPSVSIKKRYQLLYSPHGLNLREYTTFRKKYWKKQWFIFYIKAYLKFLIPGFYQHMAKISQKW